MGGRFDRPIWVTAVAGLSCLLAACGGGSGGNGSGTGGGGAATVTSVSVTCTPTSVQTGQTSQCSASVSGTGNYSSAVTWSATDGTVTSGGVFTPSAAGTATITATSAQDSTKSGNATVTVTAPVKATPSVTLDTDPSSITTAQGLSVNVTVSGGTGNPAPTGSVILTGGGYTSATATLTNGYITFLIPAGSLAVGSDTLTVTYTPDSSSSATYNSATGSASVAVAVSPTITSVAVTCTPNPIQVSQTSQCSATVMGSGNYSSAVIWTADYGSISTAGFYTAPATAPPSGRATITATSTQDSTKTGSMIVVVTPSSTITAISVICTPTSLQVSQTSQCAATVSGTGNYNSAVTWTVDSGTITSAGLYTAPATVPASGKATVTATLVEDSTLVATAILTISASSSITSVSVSCAASVVPTGQTSQCSATVTGTGELHLRRHLGRQWSVWGKSNLRSDHRRWSLSGSNDSSSSIHRDRFCDECGGFHQVWILLRSHRGHDCNSYPADQ